MNAVVFREHLFRGPGRSLLGPMCLAIVAVCLLWTGTARAQVNTGDIVGTVTDAGGAVLPQATVTVTNVATGITTKAQTDDAGNYTLTLLQVGGYKVDIEVAGFKHFASKGLVIAAGDRARVDAHLEIGDTTQTVTVEASTPALQSDSSTVGTLLTTQAVEDLPLNGRNIINLVTLSAGVTQGMQNSFSSGTRPDDRRPTSSFSANGSSDVVNNNMIDGMDNNERIIGTIGVRPSIDAIQEVKVQTSLYTAEVGRAAGAVVDLITKSGGNAFHGSIYEFLRNDILDARDFFAPASVGAKPELRQNQFGGSVGGPIRKNRTFFFADYEAFRQIKGQTFSGQVPTLAEENSVTSGTGLDLTDIGGPVIPATSFDPVGLALFKMYPKPTSSNVTGNNYTRSPGRTQFGTTYDGRVDHHFNERNNLWGRYSFNDFTTFTPTLLPAVNGIYPGDAYGPNFSFPGTAKERQQAIAIDYVHTFNQNLVLELKTAYLRSAINSGALNQGSGVAEKLGFPCTASSCVDAPGVTGVSGIPMILGKGSVYDNNPGDSDGEGNSYVGMGDSGYLPLLQYDNTFQYNASLTWVRGNHAFKFGATLIRRQAEIAQSSQGRGAYGFGNTASKAFCTDTSTCAGKVLGDIILGEAEWNYRSNQVEPPHLETWEPNGYMQDDWRVRPWLTLNYGIRYDVFTPFTEPHGHISNFDPETGLIVSPSLSGANHSNATAGIATDFSNFAPRLGFAATLRPGTVLRGGAGMTFFPMNYSGQAALSNAPFTYTAFCGIAGNAVGGSLCVSPFSNTTEGYASLSGGEPIPSVNTALATDTSNYPNEGVPAATATNFRSSYLEQYSLQLQQDLKGNVITIGYIGYLGRHMYSNTMNFNQKPSPSAPNPYASLYGNAAIDVISSEAIQRYNAFQAVLERRFSHGLSANANYTWSHNITNASPQEDGSSTHGDCVQGPCIEDNPGGSTITVRNFSTYDLGNSDLDTRHHISVAITYELPFGEHSKGLVASVIKHWSANLSGSWISGNPFTVLDNSNVTGIPGITGRPNKIGNPKLSNPSPTKGWYNAKAFAVQTTGTLGNAGRNQVYGPPQRDFDFSIFKTFPVSNVARLQFRAETFNISNTPNFAAPGSTLGTGTTAICTSTNPLLAPRQYQFALKLLF